MRVVGGAVRSSAGEETLGLRLCLFLDVCVSERGGLRLCLFLDVCVSERGEGSKGAPAIKSSVVRPSLGSWTLSFQPAIAVPSFRNHRLLHYPKRKDAKHTARTCKYIHVESESYQNLS